MFFRNLSAVMPDLIRHPAFLPFRAPEGSGTPDQVRSDGELS